MSLAKCLIEFPVDADDLAKIKALVGKSGDEGKAVSAYAKQLDKELKGLRRQLIAKGHEVAFTPKVEPKEPAPSRMSDPALARAIADAKEEGFDPETNANDLELDVAALREQGQVTPEDDVEFAAAEETYAAASAWESVMNVARGCVLK